MSVIFTNKTATKILDEYTCALSLDISRKSTGVALYESGVLQLYILSLDSKYSKTDNMWEAQLKSEFKNTLSKLVKGKEFDLVVVENTINGNNAITNKELTLLNSVFDDLVIEGVVKLKNKNSLVRPFPNVWRKELKALVNSVSNVSSISASNTKVLVEKLLSKLGFMYVIENNDISESKKKSSGYYDICDSIGMLIAYMYKTSSLNTKH